MILCVTPNTAVDRIQVVPGFKPGQVWRATALTLSAGGKGVNVARAVKSLGGEVMCAGLLGGHTGRLHAELVEREGIPSTWTWIKDETRAAVVIVDPTAEETTVINEEGPTVSDEDWDRFHADVLQLAARSDAVCLSGSLPMGVPPEALAQLVQSLNQIRRRVWVDSSGAALRAAVQSRPAVVKVNGFEAATLLGLREINSVNEAAYAAQVIQQSGLSQVVLTLGKLGAMLADDAGTWYARPPDLHVVSTIGSGDAFLAGLVTAWLEHMTAPDALRRAVAAGSANALSVGGGHFTPGEFATVLEGTKLRKIG